MTDLLFKHGGYRRLKGFQVARLIYDVTAWFVESYVDRFSRTRDQMVQAARSGVQNIAEGSEAAATSKKMEIKLTQVARASLEELRLDYEDFLRQRNLPLLAPRHPALMRFKQRRPRTPAQFQAWLGEERRRHTGGHGRARMGRDDHGRAGSLMDKHGQTGTNTEKHRQTQSHRDGRGRGMKNQDKTNRSVRVGDCPCGSLGSACLAANAALSLINLAGWFLDRQVDRLAADFETRGGFTERIYRKRKERLTGGRLLRIMEDEPYR